MENYLTEIFQSLPETLYTKELFSKVMNHLENHLTYTDFFAALMNDFFQEEGLLLIDAAYEPFRKLESEYFQLFVENASELCGNCV